MQTHTDKYLNYIEETTLPAEYDKASISFDTAEEKGSVEYKNKKYTSVNDYRQKKQYPSKEVDTRSENFSFENFCAHGTSLASALSALRYTNQQLVPGIKLKKLIGTSSSSGESKGVVIIGSEIEHINNKKVSVIKLDKNDPSGIFLSYGYSETFLSGKQNSATNIPIVVLGEGVGKNVHVKSRVDSEFAYQRVNIRLMAARNEEEKWDVLATLKSLGIYDVKVCLRQEVTNLYQAGKLKENLENLWANSTAANPNISAKEYSDRAETMRQNKIEKPNNLNNTTIQEKLNTQNSQPISTVKSTDNSELEKIHQAGKQVASTDNAELEKIHETGKAVISTDNAELEKIHKTGKTIASTDKVKSKKDKLDPHYEADEAFLMFHHNKLEINGKIEKEKIEKSITPKKRK